MSLVARRMCRARLALVLSLVLGLPGQGEGNLGGKHRDKYEARLRRERLQAAGLDPDAMTAIKVLTPANFSATVTHASKFTIVEFFAPWCTHCKKLAPTWDLFAQKVAEDARLRAHVQVATCDADAHKDLGSEYEIQGFPTLLVFHPAKYGVKAPTRLEGVGHELEDLLQYAREKLAKPPTKLRIYAFDLLAREFYLAEGDADAQQDVAARAARTAEHFVGRKKYAADIYVKLMGKALSKGNGTQAFFHEEFARLTRIVASGNQKEEAVMDFFVRQTIIDAFRTEPRAPPGSRGGLPPNVQRLPKEGEGGEDDGEEEKEAEVEADAALSREEL